MHDTVQAKSTRCGVDVTLFKIFVDVILSPCLQVNSHANKGIEMAMIIGCSWHISVHVIC